jgi:hypothetical protein
MGCVVGIEDLSAEAVQPPRQSCLDYSAQLMTNFGAQRTLSIVLAEKYSAKAQDCLRDAENASSPSEFRAWLKLAEHWAALALEANPSGVLPWKVVTEPLVVGSDTPKSRDRLGLGPSIQRLRRLTCNMRNAHVQPDLHLRANKSPLFTL